MNILFLCVGNACRSIIAENLFNKYSKKFRAESSGIKPSSKIDENTIVALKEVGINVSNKKPKIFDINKKYDIVITMCGLSCPIVPTKKLIEWNIEDCKGKSLEKFREIRNEIEKNVLQLIKEMEG